MFAKMGLSNRLNIIVISVNFLILAIVAFLANASSSAALRTQAVQRFASKNDEVAQHIDTSLSAVQLSVAGIAESLIEVEDLEDSTALRQHLLAQLSVADIPSIISRISIVRPNNSLGVLVLEDPTDVSTYFWRVYSQARDLPTNQFIRQSNNARQAVWFHQAQAYNDRLNRPVVTLAYPYSHPQGDSVLWIDILASDLSLLVQYELNEEGIVAETQDGYVMLVDENNIPLTFHNILDMGDTGRTVRDIFARVEGTLHDANGLYRIEDPAHDNEIGLFSIERIPINNWKLVGVLPEDEIPELPADVFAPILLVALAGLILLVFLVNRFIDRSIVQPLVDLGRSATEMGEGNLRFVVFHQDKADEIGTLANALDSMRTRLKESYDELQTFSRTLEERVETRTKQLAIAQKRAEENAVQLRAVYDESISVVNEPQLGPVMETFMERILTLLKANYCAIWLVTNDQQHIQLVASNPERKQGDRSVTLKINEGITGQAITRHEPIIVDDYTNYQHRVLLPDGEHLPFERGVCVPLMFSGQTIGAVVVGRPKAEDEFNISDQRYLSLFANLVSPSVRNAQLLVQLQSAVDDAHRANEVKTRFLASVTHELRTPLNLIINNMDFMRVGAFGEVSDEQVSRLDQTVRSSEHLLYLINDLLDVSKIEAGEMQLFIQNHEVDTLLEDSIDNAYALLDSYEGKEAVELITEIEENLPEVPMDARRIRQVLNNLLSNAIKFTQKGAVTLKVFAVDSGIHFSVHDTGMGIPENEMDILFSAFERTTAATEQAIEGTGLGLPISRYLVQQHGSDLTVVSEVGVGSTFAFTLPFEIPEGIDNLGVTDTQQIIAILSSKSPHTEN